jgi:lipopolysaccharide biosynthesis protein
MKLICHYLPQFHPIPENDRWWGPGFTEWTNVARARPRFRGHHQPRIPADLGFYDLRLEASRVAQAELAAEYGVGGFCYYHYWFNGKLLLERPMQEMLASGEPDFPFCVCWANGNWTRSWDGQDREVLMAQDYSAYQPDRHLAWLADALHDRRYIRVHGKPLLLIYDAESIPGLERVVEGWRTAAAGLGLPGLHLSAVRSPGRQWPVDRYLAAGFDAMNEFYPRGHRALPGALRSGVGGALAQRGRRLLGLARRWAGGDVGDARQSYPRLAREAMETADGSARVIPCVMPSWDNSARRARGATIIQNDDPALYGAWLEHALRRVADRPADERIVFVNAWNEWAEGCHLEPDLRHGRAFLEATRQALDAARASTRGAPSLDTAAD